MRNASCKKCIGAKCSISTCIFNTWAVLRAVTKICCCFNKLTLHSVGRNVFRTFHEVALSQIYNTKIRFSLPNVHYSKYSVLARDGSQSVQDVEWHIYAVNSPQNVLFNGALLKVCTRELSGFPIRLNQTFVFFPAKKLHFKKEKKDTWGLNYLLPIHKPII